LDFYCHEHGLVIEVDGAHHYEEGQAEYDQERTDWLEGAGLRVLRFTNREVMTELDRVLEQVSLALEGRTGEPSSRPSPARERELSD
jgi:very-short-patch-repair endonuclease